jgi:hypothetical protein
VVKLAELFLFVFFKTNPPESAQSSYIIIYLLRRIVLLFSEVQRSLHPSLALPRSSESSACSFQAIAGSRKPCPVTGAQEEEILAARRHGCHAAAFTFF